MASAKQPKPFDPRKAALLDDPERERWLPSEVLLERLNVSPDARVLDFGTGTARYALKISHAHPSARIDAFDSQRNMVDIALQRVRESGLSNITVVGPDGPLEGWFDRILALNVLHEIDDSDLARIRDVLKPDGFALFIDWDAAIARDFGPPADHVYTIAEARRRLDGAGFETELLEEPRFPYHYVLRAYGR